MNTKLLRLYVRSLLEGGLKAPSLTSSTHLDPATVSAAVRVYLKFMSLWNEDLARLNRDQVKPVSPVGSVSYYENDAELGANVTYGDVDYLVQFPVAVPKGASPEEERSIENATNKDYERLLSDFVKSGRADDLIDSQATSKGSPFLVIVKLPMGGYVQVDTIVTFPHYVSADSGWMPARWTPERGVKGYVTGNLYTAFGDHFNLSIGDRGVNARIRDGKTVPFKLRKDTSLVTVSRSAKTLFQDIARFLSGNDTVTLEHPGIDPSSITVDSIAAGIRDAVHALGDLGQVDVTTTLDQILESFGSKLAESVEGKLGRGMSPEKEQALLDLNDRMFKIVSKRFSS